MTEHCTPEEKQHMIDLTFEVKRYVESVQEEYKKPVNERMLMVNRMRAIMKEMQDFRRRYPDD